MGCPTQNDHSILVCILEPGLHIPICLESAAEARCGSEAKRQLPGWHDDQFLYCRGYNTYQYGYIHTDRYTCSYIVIACIYIYIYICVPTYILYIYIHIHRYIYICTMCRHIWFPCPNMSTISHLTPTWVINYKGLYIAAPAPWDWTPR